MEACTEKIENFDFSPCSMKLTTGLGTSHLVPCKVMLLIEVCLVNPKYSLQKSAYLASQFEEVLCHSKLSPATTTTMNLLLTTGI